MTSVWEDDAFRHQWVSLPGILERGELAANHPNLDQLGVLSESACEQCNEASAVWRQADADLRAFFERCVAAGHLSEVPEADAAGDAIGSLQSADPGLADDLIDLCDARGRALDAFARAKEAVLGPIVGRQAHEHLVWAATHEAGLAPGEVGEVANLSLEARCLMLALARVARGRRHLLRWILLAVVWPQSHHRRMIAEQLGGLGRYTRLQLVESILVPAGSDGAQPLAVRGLCALAIIAVGASHPRFRRAASKLRAHELSEAEGREALGEMGRDLWLRWGAYSHGRGTSDFDAWLQGAFQHVELAVEALGPAAVGDEVSPAHPDDRRHEPRVGALNLVNVGQFTEIGLLTELETGRTLDLSNDGMRLEIHHPIPIHSSIALSLALGEEMISVSGEVCSLEVLDDRLYGLGVRFVGLDPRSKECIAAYLAKHAGD